MEPFDRLSSLLGSDERAEMAFRALRELSAREGATATKFSDHPLLLELTGTKNPVEALEFWREELSIQPNADSLPVRALRVALALERGDIHVLGKRREALAEDYGVSIATLRNYEERTFVDTLFSWATGIKYIRRAVRSMDKADGSEET